MTIYPYFGFAEPFSALSHFIGAFVCAISAYPLLKLEKGGNLNRISLGLFSFGCVFLLSMSGVFHLLERDTEASQVMQRLDHAAIFVLIAGTFTPIHIIKFKGFWRWTPLVTIWITAIIGIVLKTIYFNQISELLGLGIYLAMGWFSLVTAVLLWRKGGYAVVRPLLWGSIFYSVGAIAEFYRFPVIIEGVIGPHEFFHIAVLLGITYHWRLIKQISLDLSS